MAMVVSASLAVSNVSEFIAYAKAHPGKINYGASGIGSLSHLAAELLQEKAGIKMYFVPYQSGTQVNLAVAADEIQMMILTLPDVKTALGLNKTLKALAVTSPQRTPLMPDVPAMAETLPGYSVEVNFGLLAPVGTPERVTRKLADAVKALLLDEAVRKQFVGVGVLPTSSTPEDYAKAIQADYDLWAPIIARLNLGK